MATIWLINYTTDYARMLSAHTQSVVTLHLTKETFTNTQTCWWRQNAIMFAEFAEWNPTEPNIQEDALNGIQFKNNRFIYFELYITNLYVYANEWIIQAVNKI